MSLAGASRKAPRRTILFTIHSLSGGGAERVVVHLVNNLDRDRFRCVLALGRREGPYLKDVRDDVEVLEIGATRARSALPGLIRIVRRIRPDLVFSTVGFNLAATAAKPFFPRKTSLLIREGNSTGAFLADISRQSRVRAVLYRGLYRTLYSRADAIVCQSRFMAEDLARHSGIDPSRITQIYNPVDIAKIDRRASEAGSPFREGGPNLLSVGRLDYQKGYNVLLDAFAGVVDKIPAATLTILGEGPDRADLERQVVDLGIEDAVEMPGFVDNPYVYLRNADLFVSSSRYEGCSNVILEALATGLAVVATDSPSGNRELIEEGIDGWFAAPDDSANMTDVIFAGLTSLPQLSSDRIRERSAARFALTNIVGEYEKVIARAIAT